MNGCCLSDRISRKENPRRITIRDIVPCRVVQQPLHSPPPVHRGDDRGGDAAREEFEDVPPLPSWGSIVGRDEYDTKALPTEHGEAPPSTAGAGGVGGRVEGRAVRRPAASLSSFGSCSSADAVRMLLTPTWSRARGRGGVWHTAFNETNSPNGSIRATQ